MELTYTNFLSTVFPPYQGIVDALHTHLLQNGCTFELKEAKSGYVASYNHSKDAHTLANYVFRKSGMVARIYANHLAQYAAFLETLPLQLKQKIAKAPACKRMLDPTKCNARCPMGYAFELDGALQQKCRYNCFMLPMNDETIPYIENFIKNELDARNSLQ
ncbi:hypothetical protein LJB83_00335 [Clostridia bacterium OttesenSCG-928-F22]|nr:hypothetical protein [Clostridia bacterium OttesenSCG-928-F22]